MEPIARAIAPAPAPPSATAMSVAAADQEFKAWLASSPDAVARATRRLQALLEQQGIRFGGLPLPVTIRPYCLSATEDRKRGVASQAVMHALVELGQLVSTDERALALIGFDEPARALLRLEPTAATMPIFARGDALWAKDADAGSFVEMNTDSPGMSVFSDALQTAVLDVLHEAGLQFVARAQGHYRTDRIIDALVDHYRAHGGDKSDPMIAVIDWTGVKTMDEQRRLSSALVARGCRSELFTPAELSYRGGRLYGRGLEIDLVHRRALFPELLARPDESVELLRAVRDGVVVMANPLRACIAGSKGIMALAHDRAFAGRLPEAHQEALARYIPHTILIDDDARRMLATVDHTKWVIKSCFGARGSEVVLGTVTTAEQWRAALDATRTTTWIAQRAVEIPQFALPTAIGAEWQLESFWSNWNPWLFSGRYAGATVRCSMAQVISISGRGALAACVSLQGS